MNTMKSLSSSLTAAGVTVTEGDDTLTANGWTIGATLTGKVVAKRAGIRMTLGTCATPADVLACEFATVCG